jgi:hypothetical protein
VAQAAINNNARGTQARSFTGWTPKADQRPADFECEQNEFKKLGVSQYRINLELVRVGRAPRQGKEQRWSPRAQLSLQHRPPRLSDLFTADLDMETNSCQPPSLFRKADQFI